MNQDLIILAEKLNIKIFLDGADLEIVKKFHNYNFIKGFTSNPSLMYKSKISSYENFIKEFLSITSKPISFEVVSDDLEKMKEEALKISSFASNIYVKIPVVNTKGIETTSIISDLTSKNVKLNITAIFTINQIKNIIDSVDPKNDIILSIFAGRIADTGRNPNSIFIETKNLLKEKSKKFQTLWASVREPYNIYEAINVKSDIITITSDILSKINLMNKDLENYSIETVRMFYEDAKKANIKI